MWWAERSVSKIKQQNKQLLRQFQKELGDYEPEYVDSTNEEDGENIEENVRPRINGSSR